MFRHISLIMVACLALTACTTTALDLPSPAEVSERTVIDEQAGLSITLAYTAAAKAASVAIRTGQLSPATVKKIGEVNVRAKRLVDATRAAYLAGNAKNYATSLSQANVALSDFLKAIGESP